VDIIKDDWGEQILERVGEWTILVYWWFAQPPMMSDTSCDPATCLYTVEYVKTTAKQC